MIISWSKKKWLNHFQKRRRRGQSFSNSSCRTCLRYGCQHKSKSCYSVKCWLRTMFSSLPDLRHVPELPLFRLRHVPVFEYFIRLSNMVFSQRRIPIGKSYSECALHFSYTLCWHKICYNKYSLFCSQLHHFRTKGRRILCKFLQFDYFSHD